ncbi:MAG TPA: hypothetical protein VK671_00740 [Mucilaginibacter sp.]|jgi:hypothetical protein|nr:hypothetical protein [Mucilaginibacter sp.]
MKKLINLSVAVVAVSLMSSMGLKAVPVHSNDVKPDTTVDPKKHSGTIDLDKHPEVMAQVRENLKNGKIAYQPKSGNADSLAVLAKNRQVIRDIIAYLVREHFVKDRSAITSFLLTDTEFVVNGEKLSDERHYFLKKKYIPEPGYVVYYGNDEMKGKGIFQRTDNL